MAHRVVWSRQARQNLSDIYHHVRAYDGQAAKSLADRIRSLTKALPEHPWIGRIVPEVGREDVRERILGNYRIVYQIADPKQVRILYIFHTAQEELPGI